MNAILVVIIKIFNMSSSFKYKICEKLCNECIQANTVRSFGHVILPDVVELNPLSRMREIISAVFDNISKIRIRKFSIIDTHSSVAALKYECLNINLY